MIVSSSVDCKDQESFALDSGAHEQSTYLLTPNLSSKAPGLSVIKERSFESQISPGSSVSSLPREHFETNSGKCVSNYGEAKKSWSEKNALPLIDDEEIPSYYHGRANASSSELQKLDSEQNRATASRYEPWDKSLAAPKNLMRNPHIGHPDVQVVDNRKREIAQESIQKNKNYFRKPSLSRQSNQTQTSSGFSPNKKIGISPKNSPAGARALFNIDDAIEGTSDAIRDLLHTSDAIDVVMKHTTDDIENVLE